MCKQSVRHVSATKYLSSIVSSRTACRQILVFFFLLFSFVFFSVFVQLSLSRKECSWTRCKTFLYWKIDKVSMNPVHDRGSMNPVHDSGPWTGSKEGVYGPPVHVLSSPVLNGSLLTPNFSLNSLFLHFHSAVNLAAWQIFHGDFFSDGN